MMLLGPTRVVCATSIKNLCRCSYQDHPRGCPNYGKKEDCPPQAKFFPDVYNEDVYVAAIVFDFKRYVGAKMEEHPDWTEKALRNPRHWQGHLRSELKKFTREKLRSKKCGDSIIFNPEAMGVNVTRTCASVGIALEWPPRKKACHIFLIGTRKNLKRSI